ncbi:L,D-transpeptidase family protein [Neptuniibacter sp.]|uniref:L,D-transpeptidase family protein n=1 Tax=Neptuniibacter sp. TaxID=1962643 RepID=UPI0026060238|nr:L,D-transpeptidase family protein [Neptuniibacter sp.]MCP4595184.1 L,D-transpeptidase family protein [Neptuniibacter sp.]
MHASTVITLVSALFLYSTHNYAVESSSKSEFPLIVDSESLTQAITPPSTLDKPSVPVNSPSDQISQLHQLRMKYEHISNTISWPKLSRGPLLSFGDNHPQIPKLREMLVQLGDLDQANCDDHTQLFDIELHEALLRFQERHGGKADGILGPATRRQLNVSPRQRADQILLNIHRLQAFQPEQERYIQVNIPDYRLHLFENGEKLLSMKTIVGKRKRKTPVFDTEIDRVVVNPSWHVPKSIAYKDILPVFAEDPDYLKKINLKVVTGWGEQKKFMTDEEIDLEKMYKGKVYQRLWEPPSDKNTLGKVKFLTSSHYSVYLHDTSAKRLFDESKRAFSSGCIRLEQPRKLADALLKMGKDWEQEEVSPLFSDQETVHIKLDKPVKLYVTYWTSWVDKNGQVHFRDDLYRRDRYELSQLKQQSSQELFTSSN